MIPSLLDYLCNVQIAEKKVFYIERNEAQSLYWEEYGLRIHFSQNAVSSPDDCKVAITVLVGGHFKFPKRSVLVSAVYGISICKPLLKPLTLEIQHCVILHKQAEANCLHFVRAIFHPQTQSYDFKQLLDGGQFYPGNRYGSIISDQFSFVAIIADWSATPENSDNEGISDDKESTNIQEESNASNEETNEDDSQRKGELYQ